MKLVSFRVRNFRSVNDSGTIEAARITTLVGRNESGKTNLLLALKSLNPVGGIQPLSPIKDFPRHRRLPECNDETPVLNTMWELDADEQAELADLYPRAKGVKLVEVTRPYAGKRYVGIQGLPPFKYAEKDVAADQRKISPALRAAAEKVEDGKRAAFAQAIERFDKEVATKGGAVAWAKVAKPAFAALRQALATAEARISDEADESLARLEELAEDIAGDETTSAEARNWIAKTLPVFVFLDEYPELAGHQNLADYLHRKSQNPSQLKEADHNFEKLCKVAGVSPQQLHDLLSKKDQETRNQLVNRAGAVVTSEIRRLWKDRPLKVRFNLDAEHFDTIVSDPNATYDVEVNLDERSRGFKWFFSFYISFAADTKGGSAEKAILLLDEPGLYLHAMSQGDLLKHFEDDFKNQIIYTTHSPFMVPAQRIETVRTVNIDESTGTTVTNDPTGDAKTLFPLQTALGYSVAQSLFVGPTNLVVEGVTDYWILSSVSGFLADSRKKHLPSSLTITPSGGAQKVSYMVALLTSERLNVIVLLDSEKQAKSTKDEMVKGKLIRQDNVVLMTEAFRSSPPSEADLEDLLEPAEYERIVRDVYATELGGRVLTLNQNIPRIAKRVEAALSELGIEFHKTRPAKRFIEELAKNPKPLMTPIVIERFECLFETIRKRLEKEAAREARPFG